MSLENSIRYIHPFVIARGTSTVTYDRVSVLFGDAPLNHDNFPDAITYLKQNDIEGWSNIPANGFRFQSLENWRAFLERARNSGVRILEFTLYGKAEAHDWFAVRKDDYRAIHALARLWHQLGGDTYWRVFVHKKNFVELSEIRSEILNQYGKPCIATHWSYLGHGARIDDLRFEVDDLNRVDDDTRTQLKDFKPESDWVTRFATSVEQPFPTDPGILHVVVDREGNATLPYTLALKGHAGLELGNIEQPPGDFIRMWESRYHTWGNSYPPVGELCRKYGDPAGKRLYDAKSIIRKWCHAFEITTKIE